MLRRIIPFFETNGDMLIVDDEKPYSETDAVELARFYESAEADEIFLIERSGLSDRVDKMLALVERLTKNVFLPLIAAGGIDNISKIKQFIRAGCTKVSINYQALKSTDFLRQAAEKVGRERLILTIYFRKTVGNWEVYSKFGKPQFSDVIEWAQHCENYISEIILNPFHGENNSNILDVELAKKLSDNVKIPVIMGAGTGTPQAEQIIQLFDETKVSGIIGSNMFHYKESSIRKLKQILKRNGILVRPGTECISTSASKHTGQIDFSLLKQNQKEDIELLNKIKKASEETES